MVAKEILSSLDAQNKIRITHNLEGYFRVEETTDKDGTKSRKVLSAAVYKNEHGQIVLVEPHSIHEEVFPVIRK